MSDDYEQHDHPVGNRWGGSAWTLIGALMVVLVIAGAGVWLVLSRNDTNGTAPPPPTSTPNPNPASDAGSAPDGTTSGVPDGFVGGREVVGGVPVGFAHTEQGAINAAAVWTAYAFVCPADQRAEGVATVMGPAAPSLDPCNPVVPDSTSIDGLSPLAVRGSVAGDSGVVEVMTMGSYDFLPQSGWDTALEIVTLTLTWDPAADDWRITTWSRRDLVDDAAPPITPDLFAGFQWLRPIGAVLTSTPFVTGTRS